MRKRLKYLLPITLIIAMLLTGCSSVKNAVLSTATDTATAIAEAVVSTTSEVVVDTEFSAKDLEVGYEDSTATHITMDDSSIEVSGDGAEESEGVITISEEGTYVITGSITDGQIVVDAEDTDKVQIVLNGATINCADNAAIYIKNADKVFISLKENTVNTLSDGSNYVQKDENTVDGVIFSMSDLTMNGNGTLNITANYKHGIASKDKLTITGGTFNIIAQKDAINGKDCVRIKDGMFTLSASSGNGIQSKNAEDSTKGYVYISGGTITVTNCREGIEGTVISIAGGTIDITTSDDGFNASSASVSTETNQEENVFAVDTNCFISISGGSIKVNASGDGIDSNGSISISGGEIYVSGPTENNNAALDYNGTADVTGGAIIVTGSSGMAQGFSDTSTQYSLLYNLTTSSTAGTEVTLADAEGNEVASFTPDKQYQSIVISTPDLVSGATYSLTSGDQTADITLTSIVTSNGQQGGMQGGMGDGPGKGQRTRPVSGN